MPSNFGKSLSSQWRPRLNLSIPTSNYSTYPSLPPKLASSKWPEVLIHSAGYVNAKMPTRRNLNAIYSRNVLLNAWPTAPEPSHYFSFMYSSASGGLHAIFSCSLHGAEVSIVCDLQRVNVRASGKIGFVLNFESLVTRKALLEEKRF